VEACLGCHDDRHSRAYQRSPHAALWDAEREPGRAGTGVSCATCHLPRVNRRVDGADVVAVQHNQNANLRPNEKMARTVCLACHGLAFSLDALADPSLVATNFTGTPLRHVAGIDMAMSRINSRSN
jgi:formate-dependent nitrite reductase cytochrome c552 subunit